MLREGSIVINYARTYMVTLFKKINLRTATYNSDSCSQVHSAILLDAFKNNYTHKSCEEVCCDQNPKLLERLTLVHLFLCSCEQIIQ